MALKDELEKFFSDMPPYANPPATPYPAANIVKANMLVNQIIGPWFISECTVDGGTGGKPPLLFNPAGLPLVIAGMSGPPVPVNPSPNNLLIEQGITLLFAAVPFAPGMYLPGMVAPSVPALSTAPTVPFVTPQLPAAPPAAVAAAWDASIKATVASTMCPFVDLAPGTPPVPTPGTLPIIPGG